MKQYVYYSKFDSKQEPHGKLEAINLEDAILLASHYKEMSKKDDEYEQMKTPNDIEGGALRAGGAPKLLSKDYIGLQDSPEQEKQY